MTPEAKLAALFAAEAPPTRDYAFQAVVAERIAARRAWITVLALVPWAVAAAAILWALGPIMTPLAASLAAAIKPSATVLIGAAAAGLTALWLARRFSAA